MTSIAVDFSSTFVTSEVIEEVSTTSWTTLQPHNKTHSTNSSTSHCYDSSADGDDVLFKNWIRYQSQDDDEDDEDPLRRFCIITPATLRLYYNDNALILRGRNNGSSVASRRRLKSLATSSSGRSDTAAAATAVAASDSTITEEVEERGEEDDVDVEDQMPFDPNPVYVVPLREIVLADEQADDLRVFFRVGSQGLIFHCADFEVHDDLIRALQYSEHRMVGVGVNTLPDTRLIDAEQQIDALEEDLADAQDALDDANNFNEQLQQLLAFQALATTQADERLKLQELISGDAQRLMRGELAASQSEKERLRAAHAAEVARLEAEHKKRLSELQLKVGDCTTSSSATQRELDALQEDYEALRKKFAKASAENDLLRSDCENIKRMYELGEKDHRADVSSLKAALNDALAKLKETREVAEAKEERLQRENAKLSREVQRLTDALNRQEQLCKKRDATIAAQKEELHQMSSLQGTLSEARARIQELLGELSSEHARSSSLESQLAELHKKLKLYILEIKRHKELPRKWLFSLPTPEEFARIGVCLKRATKVTKHIKGCEQMSREFENFVPTMTKMVELYDDFVQELNTIDG